MRRDEVAYSYITQSNKTLIDRRHTLIQVKARKPVAVFCFDVRAGFEQQTNNWRMAILAGNMKRRVTVLNKYKQIINNFFYR